MEQDGNDFDEYDEDGDGVDSGTGTNNDPSTVDSKRQARAQHNALERRRRDNIKDMYASLSKELPNFSSDRASRAQILKKTIDTIKNNGTEIEDLSAEVKKLEALNEQMKKQLVQNQQPSAAFTPTNPTTTSQ